MSHLHQALAERIKGWRDQDYPCKDYPAISEILEWACGHQTGNLRYLRRPQFRALETYWCLRLIEKTPHVFELYQKLYPKQYGKFIKHEPARAKVKIARKDGQLVVEIEDFISPTIIERL